MFPYKFAAHSQKNDTNQVGGGFINPLKRSNLGVTSSATLSENTPKMEFDGGLSQSLSSRRIEAQALGNSAYLRQTAEMVDSKPHIPAIGTPSRIKEEPIDPNLNLRLFGTPTPSRDHSKRFIKANTHGHDLDSSVGETQHEEAVIGSMTASIQHFQQLTKEKAQQREYIMDLELRLAAKNGEFATLETTYKQAMDKLRDALGRAAKNHSALKSELDDFKRSSESSSLIISEAKETMESLVDLRDSARIFLRDLEPRLDNDGRFILTAETRETVHELRSELSKTQQVADLLRDKLHTMGTELAEARARVSELEEWITADKSLSKSISDQIRRSAEHVAEVTRYLQEQRHEATEATMKAYEMEQQLVLTQTRLQEAQSTITSMKAEMTAREESNGEQSVKLRTLRRTIDFQEENVKAFEARARKAEEELVQTLNHNHELQGRLGSAKDLEKNLMQQVSWLLSERDEAKDKLQSTGRQLAEVQASEKSLCSDLAKASTERNALADKLKLLDDAKREVNMYREKYSEYQVSLKVLQERFDDQCVTLAASKESVGELQERLHETQRQATEVSNESTREMIHLQEQNEMLKARLDRAEKETEDKTESLQTLQMELSRKEGAFQALLETERSSKKEALGQVQEANTRIKSLLTEHTQKDSQIQELTRRLAAAEAPSTEHEREVAALKVRMAELEATEKRLADRAVTICRRYENNDLNDDEKALITTLMQKARNIHDREMVEKSNGIKLRDNLIKQHEARIAQLEEGLARRIHDEAKSTKGTHEQGNLMTVDATKPPKPLSDHPPETRGAGHAPSSAAPHGTTSGAMHPSLAGASRSTTGYATFSKLCREDTDEIACLEEAPPVATGKRVLFADEDEDEEASRPARRKQIKGTAVDKWDADQAATSGIGKKKTTRRR